MWFVFLVLLVASTATFFFSSGVSSGIVVTGEAADPGDETWAAGAFVTTVASGITAVVSFLGFFSTTVLAWRQERRESAVAALERKQMELELEKTRLELERLRHGEGEKSPSG
jgi:hypothetical protein